MPFRPLGEQERTRLYKKGAKETKVRSMAAEGLPALTQSRAAVHIHLTRLRAQLLGDKWRRHARGD